MRDDSVWKLIIREDAGDDELYHLEDDPEELHNRLSEMPEVADELRQSGMKKLEENSAGLRSRIKTTIVRRKLRALNDPGSNAPADPVEAQLKTLGYID